MKVYQASELTHFTAQQTVITVGTFDGVHRGHAKILKSLREKADQIHAETVVFTFWPHPRQVINKQKSPDKLLTTIDDKIRLFEQSGAIDHLVIYPFTKAFAQIPYCDFIENILIKQLKMKALVTGFNNQFGHDAKGRGDTLAQCGKNFCFDVVNVSPVTVTEGNISSTLIRNLLRKGEIEAANRMLGYSFFVIGNVVSGERIGRSMGFPTANVKPQENYKLIPPIGVYAVETTIDENRYGGMLNIGKRPTVDKSAKRKTIEVNIFDFHGDLYHKTIQVDFIARIRDEMKFENIDSLQNQLKKDRTTVRQLLHRRRNG